MMFNSYKFSRINSARLRRSQRGFGENDMRILAGTTPIALLSGMLWLGLTSPAQAAPREPEAILCPQTIASPEVQKRIDAGEKPESIKSWYKPGLVNPQGFCTVKLWPNDPTRMYQSYNEATTIDNIPVRFEYDWLGLSVFAGEKAQPLSLGSSDMFCWAPDDDEIAVDCTISLTSDGTMFLRHKEGRAVEEKNSVRIDTKQMFGIDLKGQSRMVHFELQSNPSIFLSEIYYQPINIDCTKPYWKNVAANIKITVGSRNGNAIAPVRSFQMAGLDNANYFSEIIPPTVPRFDIEGDDASPIIQSVVGNEVVQIDVETACDGNFSKAFTTELPRLMAFIFENLKRPMMSQR